MFVLTRVKVSILCKNNSLIYFHYLTIAFISCQGVLANKSIQFVFCLTGKFTGIVKTYGLTE